MDIQKIDQFCQTLLKTSFSPQCSLPSISCTLHDKVLEGNISENDVSSSCIFREDIENLSHFTQIWTDVIEREVVERDVGDHSNIETTIRSGYLVDVGFFYVQINHETPILEFFHLLTKIPWENLRSPGLDQISYSVLANLIEESNQRSSITDPQNTILDGNPYRIAIQVMVLGNFFHFWSLINPYSQMAKTSSTTKLLLSGMGNLTIRISKNFIKNCQELIESVDL